VSIRGAGGGPLDVGALEETQSAGGAGGVPAPGDAGGADPVRAVRPPAFVRPAPGARGLAGASGEAVVHASHHGAITASLSSAKAGP
jgi:hypothetical protein